MTREEAVQAIRDAVPGVQFVDDPIDGHRAYIEESTMFHTVYRDRSEICDPIEPTEESVGRIIKIFTGAKHMASRVVGNTTILSAVQEVGYYAPLIVPETANVGPDPVSVEAPTPVAGGAGTDPGAPTGQTVSPPVEGVATDPVEPPADGGDDPASGADGGAPAAGDVRDAGGSEAVAQGGPAEPVGSAAGVEEPAPVQPAPAPEAAEPAPAVTPEA